MLQIANLKCWRGSDNLPLVSSPCHFIDENRFLTREANVFGKWAEKRREASGLGQEDGGTKGLCLVPWVRAGGWHSKAGEALQCSSPAPTQGWEHGNRVCEAGAFFLSKTSFALLSHSGWALGRSCDLQGPEQGPLLQPGGRWVQSHEHAGGW